jgi:protein phosphatase
MALDLILEASRTEAATLAWSWATDPGAVRALNEDAVVAEAPVFLVADGVGGQEAGEIASGLVATRFRSLVADGPVPADAVAEELRIANDMLRDAARPMGTTAVGMVVVEHRGVTCWLVLNVGDSRAYCWADGRLVQLTRDHSHVQDLVDAGELDAEAARHHPDRNVITRALGAADEVAPDFWVRPIRAGERYLLCSDGLSGEVDDALLAEVLGIGLTPDETVDSLVHHALRAGGRDNVSAIVIDVLRAADDAPVTTRRRAGTWSTPAEGP